MTERESPANSETKVVTGRRPVRPIAVMVHAVTVSGYNVGMPEFTPLISESDVPLGTSAEVVAAGRIFAVYNVDGEFHVLDGICPHAGGPLGKGALNGCIVTCPWHGWQFDVANGRHCLNETLTQPKYEVQILNGMVCAAIDPV